MAENGNTLMEKLVALCKRRGFIFQSSEIYGGLNGFWDYGPLGVELKRNIKAAWWEDIVRKREDMLGLDASIIMNPRVWEASGHVGGFSDPMVDCRECKSRFRADQIILYQLFERPAGADSPSRIHDLLSEAEGQEAAYSFRAEANMSTSDLQVSLRRETGNKKAKVKTEPRPDLPGYDFLFAEIGGKTYYMDAGVVGNIQGGEHCPKCGGELTEPRQFNLMFQTYVGAVHDESAIAYLRPETAQGIFADYKSVLDSSRVKLPFGIAQIGKAFRNEINPRNYTFRSREFEQMEIEFFCHPNEAARWYEYWRDARFQWYVDHGLTSSKLRLRDHEADELAHYAASCADIEYAFPFGVSELEGIANRTDFDLRQHQACSGRDLTYFDDETKERFLPYVIEPSGGVDRTALAILCEAYTEDEAPDEKGVMQQRVVMKLHPRLAPTKVAVFPLVKKEGMPEIAAAIHEQVKAAGIVSFYDEKGAVGRRYRRQDEAGTPFCVTVDGQTLQDNTVTIRDRDTLAQERISKDEVLAYVRERLG